MAVIRIKNSTTAGLSPSGLTKGELAVNLTDKTLWVGALVGTDPAIYLSGVQTFNGLTGAVTGVTVGGDNQFTQLNRFEAGISASGATLGTLVVNEGISAAGGITFNSLSHFTQGLSAASLSRFNEITVNNTAQFNSPIITYGGYSAITGKTTLFHLEITSPDAGITFNSLSHFTQGLSGSGATLGRLVVNSGISASGGVTFHNNVWVGGLLTANGGISAAGGVTFANTVYVGQTLTIAGELAVIDEGTEYSAEFIRSVGETADLPTTGRYAGQMYWVRGPVSDQRTQNYSGYYYWDDYVAVPEGITAKWVRLTNARNYQAGDTNFDGIINGTDLSYVLAAWGSEGYDGGNFTLAVTNGISAAFEVKIFGVTTGKKARPFRITSDVTDPQIFMAGEFVDVDAKLVVGNAPNEPAIEIPEGKGYAYFSNGMQVYGGATVGGNVNISGLLSVTGGISAGCGVTFSCLTHFTQGLSASGATLGTLVVNGGATFNGPVYMGATLTMNSNIRFNSGYGINAGFVDAGWY